MFRGCATQRCGPCRSPGVRVPRSDDSCRSRTGSGRTTHVVEVLPAQVRLIDAPGELRDVVLDVLGWSTDDFTGETVLLCRLLDGTAGEIPARWTDLPWRETPVAPVGGLGSPVGWRLFLARGERLRRPRRGRVSVENGGARVGTARVSGGRGDGRSGSGVGDAAGRAPAGGCGSACPVAGADRGGRT